MMSASASPVKGSGARVAVASRDTDSFAVVLSSTLTRAVRPVPQTPFTAGSVDRYVPSSATMTRSATTTASAPDAFSKRRA